MLSDFRFRLRALFRRSAVERELDQELQWHLDHLQQKLEARGLSAEEARRQARIITGGVEQTKEACRDARGTRYFEDLIQDVGYAIRTLRKRPALLVTAVLSLALGIGANAVVFGAVKALLLRPLDVPAAERIVAVNRGGGPSHSFPNYRDLRVRASMFDHLYAYRIAPLALQVDGPASRAWGLLVTGNYFDALGIDAAVGRLIAPADDAAPGAGAYAVLSYDLWQRRFGGDPAVVGRTIRINQHPYTVVGVAPRSFHGTDVMYRAELWVPLSMQPQVERGSWLDERGVSNCWIGGRLRPGVTRDEASAELAVLAAQLAQEHRENEGLRLSISAPGLAGAFLREPAEAFATGVMLLAALVLLTACVNLASLLAARTTDRQRELSIRLSIGASRWRIARQLLTESMVIAVLGGAAAAVLATTLLGALSRWRMDADLPVQVAVEADGQVLLYAGGAACLAGLLFGLAPALRALRADPAGMIKGDPAPAAGGSYIVRDALLAVQVVLCAFLVTASLMAVRGLIAALHAPLGFQPDGLAVLGVDLGEAGYTEERGRQFQRLIIDQIAAWPGVSSVAYADSIPLGPNQSSSSFYREDEPDLRPHNAVGASYFTVSPGYFATAGTTLLAGREFSTHDQQSSVPVAIVNETFARRLFGTVEAVGRRFRHGGGPPLEVVGIVQDGKYVTLTEEPTGAVFWPAAQRYSGETVFVARTARASNEVASEIRQLVARLDPALPAYGAGSARQAIGLKYVPAYASAWALGSFGVLAVMLACTGVYGLTSVLVSRRRRELAIRRAVGAQDHEILGSVFTRTGAVLAAGSLVGIACAVAAGRLLSALVYHASAQDPVVLLGAVGLMASLGVISACRPALRALRLDPVAELRQD